MLCGFFEEFLLLFSARALTEIPSIHLEFTVLSFTSVAFLFRTIYITNLKYGIISLSYCWNMCIKLHSTLDSCTLASTNARINHTDTKSALTYRDLYCTRNGYIQNVSTQIIKNLLEDIMFVWKCYKTKSIFE